MRWSSIYLRAYDSLYAGTRRQCRDEGLFIRLLQQIRSALYAFDLTADLGEDDHFCLLRQGSVCVVLKFAAPLAATISVIAYAEFKNVIEMDRDRNIIFDFGV